MRTWGFALSLCISCLFVFSSAYGFSINSGGATSVAKNDSKAFSLPSANMSFERRLDFSVGNSFFRNPWVLAPATTTSRDGLGPLFNTNGCQNCHIRDGRGHLPHNKDDNSVSLLVRLSVKPETQQEKEFVIRHGVIPHPKYGDQIQDFSAPDVPSEAQISIDYQTKVITLADDTSVMLSKPVLTLRDLAYGPFTDNVVFSMRIAPAMIGLGLLESIAEQDIKALADEEDANSDGISGRWNAVWDVEAGEHRLGRFGWKAEQPSLKQQNAAAFNGDIGITSTLFPEENCTLKQAGCNAAALGGVPEVSDKILNLVTFYSRNLAVPKRRNITDPKVKLGEIVFTKAGCHNCHITTFKTPVLPDQPEQSNQTIHPYTDLLLHDMGEDLADNREVFSASGSEWRTPPLWGIGLTKQVSGFEHYLHDGRARSLLEAVLWHGGEAQAAQKFVVNAPKADRDALIAFLKSL